MKINSNRSLLRTVILVGFKKIRYGVIVSFSIVDTMKQNQVIKCSFCEATFSHRQSKSVTYS